MKLTDAIRAWLTYRERLVMLSLVATSTYRTQNAVADCLTAKLGDHDLDALRKSHIEFYIGERLQTCQPITVRGEINILRQVLNWCVDEAMLVDKPRMPSVKVPLTETAMPGDDAFAWVLRWLPRHHSRALEFMLLTGLSPHELERVEVRDIDFSYDFSIRYRLRIGQRPDFHVKQPSRRRFVPMGERVRTIWNEAVRGLHDSDSPFPTVAAMTKATARLRSIPPESDPAPAGANQITPKWMRKWFASHVSNDQPEHVLQRLMGHSPGSKVTRRHYVRSSDQQGADAVAGLETPK